MMKIVLIVGGIALIVAIGIGKITAAPPLTPRQQAVRTVVQQVDATPSSCTDSGELCNLRHGLDESRAARPGTVQHVVADMWDRVLERQARGECLDYPKVPCR